ncbi:MAG: sigma-70 family RNA polymerase sigma factor [Verrucomicrobiae bacterium]|nr:sigma-70 family RNA polymerase sigma factor [Verrucomicrobiae bacterium]
MDVPTEKSTTALMQEFSRNASPEAFRALVDRYLPVVYGAALRRCGDPALAEDVSQLVFTDFAVRTPSLRADERIGAWLHRAAMLTTGDLLKSERRRKKREQLAADLKEIDRIPDSTAWAELKPVIDESIAQLRTGDRQAIILRFYENRPLREVGVALGISEDAAQKRVERALAKLRSVLPKCGMTAALPMLGSLLSDRVDAAVIPSALGEKISATALLNLSHGGLAAWWFRHGLLPQYALTAAAIAFIGSALPMLGNSREVAAAPTVSTQVSGETAVATETSATTQPPAIQEPQSLEEIIDALGKLLAQPPTSLDRARCSVLFGRIPEAQAGRAFALMDQTWPVTTMRRADKIGFNWRYRTIQHWGKDEPEAALAWVLRNTGLGAPLYLERSHWDTAIYTLLQQWADRDWDAAWKWTLAGIEDGSLLVKDDMIDLTKSAISGLRERLVEHAGLGPAMEMMVALQSNTGMGTLRREVKTYDDFVAYMEAAMRFRSPGDRRNLRRQMVYECPPALRPPVLEWIKARPSHMERAELAWALNFPRLTDEVDPAAIPLNEFSNHADWMLSIDPHLSNISRSKAFKDLTWRWLRYDPKAAADWILANHFHPFPTAMGAIISSLPTEEEAAQRSGPLASADEWKAQAARLLKAWRRLDPELYQSVVIERYQGNDSTKPGSIAEFLQAYDLGEVTE